MSFVFKLTLQQTIECEQTISMMNITIEIEIIFSDSRLVFAEVENPGDTFIFSPYSQFRLLNSCGLFYFFILSNV